MFQPIVDLSTRTVMGLEALARGPAGTVLEFPDRLFAAARVAGRLAGLDMLCAERALECAAAAPVPPPLLFVNVEPAVMDQPLSPRLIELITAGLPFREILEFTERALPTVPGSMLRIAGQAHEWGNGLALDDVGVDPMSLAFLPILEPEVIKLDMSLVRAPHAGHTRAVCAVVGAEAQRTGAVVIAEGIETEDDLRHARALGAHWGQGWLFGRPGPIDGVGHRFDAAGADALPRPRPGFHQPTASPFQVAAAHGPATPGDAHAVAATLARMRDIAASAEAAVVVVSCPASGFPGIAVSLHELAGRARSIVVLDRPVPDELAVAVIGPGHGYAVCVQTPHEQEAKMVILNHLPPAAAVARALLNRHR
ncbi:EAL domain-containing protein [Actinoplanes sp. NEAU-A11]|uniref:EAL domain-containing protein n=1 Tax=Actinoplanes aureus TaxID=2792083 RepID=A0A931G081_9ACTN|nr:EAL domain-containing protein [Actinoplanes aureus]